jgi:hypothetical protein
MIDSIKVSFEPPPFPSMFEINQKLAILLGQNIRDDVAQGGHPPWKPRIYPEGISSFRYIGATMKTEATDHYAQASWGEDLVYARVQQYGASIVRTDRMRRFFWAKWYETKEEFWKGMALSQKATIDIPVRSATSWIYARREEYEEFIGKEITIKEPGKQ